MGIIKRRGTQYEIGNWYVGWKSKTFEVSYRSHGYESKNAELHISMFGWHSMLRLPWKCKENILWREEKKYGISVHDNTVFFHWGYDLKGWDIPFVNYGTAVRWERYCGPDDLFQMEDRLHWDEHYYRTDRKVMEPTTWTYNYTDPYDGKVVPCRFWVEELEWRPKWLRWTKRFAKVRRFIEVEFSEEMGPRKGSWKGGTIGCGFNMLKGEHPMECIKRMEKEYKFS